MPDSILLTFMGGSSHVTGHPLAVVIIALVTSILVYPIYHLYFHPLRSYPGPKSSAATPIPYLRAILAGRLSYYCYELHQKYGEVVRIAPNQLSYVSSDAWKDIYERRPGHALLEKDPSFYRHPPNGVPGIVTVNHTEHPRIRRPFSHAFSEKALREQQPLIKVYIDLLIQRLHDVAEHDDPINIVSYYNWTTFDITGDLVFGESFEMLDKAVPHPWVEMLFGSIKLMAYFSVANAVPGLAQIVHITLGKKLTEEGLKHMQFTTEKVRRRLARETDRADFITRVLEYNNEKGVEKGFKGMTQEELDSTSNHILVAGAETTATLLSGATYFLLSNPIEMETLKMEIRKTFSSGDEITWMAVSKLPYLRACLDETLRLYPPVAAGLLRVIPPQGETISGKFVPGNTIVSSNQWATYHSAQHFRDPHAFVPERWLGTPRYANDNQKVLNPFSLGPRNCLGKNLAYIEMNLILARILFDFDLELMDDSKAWGINQEHYWLWEKPPLNVKLHPIKGKISEPTQQPITL